MRRTHARARPFGGTDGPLAAELFSAYAEAKDALSADDIEDVKLFMRMLARRRRRQKTARAKRNKQAVRRFESAALLRPGRAQRALGLFFVRHSEKGKKKPAAPMALRPFSLLWPPLSSQKIFYTV